MSIVRTDNTNLNEWTELTVKLFPHHSFNEMYEANAEFLKSGKEIGFLYRQGDKAVAFMNISIRHEYVNGSTTSPVVFIEAIYVLPENRQQGIARELIAWAEEFAKENGITQLASDCLIENTESEQFHEHCGFEEMERVICFVKNV